jgi:hypothetical protein
MIPHAENITSFAHAFPPFALNCGFYPTFQGRLMARAYGGTAPDRYVPLLGFERATDEASLPPFLREPNSETSRQFRSDWEGLRLELRGLHSFAAEGRPGIYDIPAIWSRWREKACDLLKAGRFGAAAMILDEARIHAQELRLGDWTEPLDPAASEAWLRLMTDEADDAAFSFFAARALAAPLTIGVPATEDVIAYSIAHLIMHDEGPDSDLARDIACAYAFKAYARFERMREPEVAMAISPLFEAPADAAVGDAPALPARKRGERKGMTVEDWDFIREDLRGAAAFFKKAGDDAPAARAAEFATMASEEADAIERLMRPFAIPASIPRGLAVRFARLAAGIGAKPPRPHEVADMGAFEKDISASIARGIETGDREEVARGYLLSAWARMMRLRAPGAPSGLLPDDWTNISLDVRTAVKFIDLAGLEAYASMAEDLSQEAYEIGEEARRDAVARPATPRPDELKPSND